MTPRRSGPAHFLSDATFCFPIIRAKGVKKVAGILKSTTEGADPRVRSDPGMPSEERLPADAGPCEAVGSEIGRFGSFLRDIGQGANQKCRSIISWLGTRPPNLCHLVELEI